MSIQFDIDFQTATPVNAVSRPRISGRQRMGATLQANPGGLTGALSYQWRVGGVDQPGETSAFFVPSAHMIAVTCGVTGDEGAYETPAYKILHNHAMASHNTSDDNALGIATHMDATHILIHDGAFSNPSNWDTGTVPGDGAVMLVPVGRVMTYDVAASPRFDRMRVDGTYRASLTQNLQILVETIVVQPGGVFEDGSAAARRPAQFTSEYIFSDRSYRIDPDAPTDLDIAHDPELLSRGFVCLGKASIWANRVTPWLRTSAGAAPVAGDESLTLEAVPTGWEVGARIVLPATYCTEANHIPTDENEARVITQIDGTTVHWEGPLLYDHDHQNPNVFVAAETDADLIAADTTITLATADAYVVVGDRVVLGFGGTAPQITYVTAFDAATRAVTLQTPVLANDPERRVRFYPTNLQPGIIYEDRNITMRSESPHEQAPWRRAHGIFQHGAAIVDLWGLRCLDMGRTDKSTPTGVIREGAFLRWNPDYRDNGLPKNIREPLNAQSNLQSRYPLHLHHCGFKRGSEKPIVRDCYVRDAPAWGLVHHACEADFFTNVCYRFVGAGMVSESANETGAWVGNLIAGTRRGFNGDVADVSNPKNGESSRAKAGDFGFTGMGMFFRGRAMRVNRNMVMGTTNGYTFFHRVDPDAADPDRQLSPAIDPLRKHLDVYTLAEITNPAGVSLEDGSVSFQDIPIRHFNFNEVMGSTYGFTVTKSGAAQNNDLGVNLLNFKASAVVHGAHVEYIGTYNFIDPMIVATSRFAAGQSKTGFWNHRPSVQITHVRPVIRNFVTAMALFDRNGPSLLINHSVADDPLFMVVEPRFLACTHGYDFGPFSDTYNAQTTGVDGVTVLERTRIFPLGSPPVEVEPSIIGDFIYVDWDGELNYSAAAFTNQQPLIKRDTIGDQPLPKVWDPVGLFVGTYQEYYAGSDYVKQVANINTVTRFRRMRERNGYWTENGDNILLNKCYFSDRVTGRPILHTLGIRLTNNTAGFVNNGPLIRSSTPIVRADITVSTARNTPVNIDVLSAATGETGATLALSRDHLKPDAGELMSPDGQVIHQADGTIDYMPDLDFTGDDAFFVFVEDGRLGARTVKISITVT